jgi:hypothetical protein
MIQVQRRPDGSIIMRASVEIEVPPGASMLEAEEALMSGLNDVGTGLTGGLLESMDADGKPLLRGGRNWTAKRQKEVRHVETPWGCAVIARWAYQPAIGGTCFHPMDQAAGLIGAATPKFAQMVSGKLVELPAATVVSDLRDNHARKVSGDFVQRMGELVSTLAGEIVPGAQAEGLPPAHEVATISVGVDSAAILMGARRDDATTADARTERTREWRMATIGTITLYNHGRERLGTIYAATAPPEDKAEGKIAFWEVMDRELAAVKDRYPGAQYTGLSDGASDLLPWLRKNTRRVTLDFYHASGYLCSAAGAFAHERPRGAPEDWWAQQACHHLRHEVGGAAGLLTVMEERLADARRLREKDREALDKAVTYFRNNVERMDYAECAAEGLPIGSGVTEAGCKLIVKKRFCGPGMTWSFRMAGHLLKLRAAAQSAGERWKAVWQQVLSNNNAMLDL